MFAFGLIAHTRHPNVNRSPRHPSSPRRARRAKRACAAKEQRRRAAATAHTASVAVIARRGRPGVNTGGEASLVRSAAVVAPLNALRQSLGRDVTCATRPADGRAHVHSLQQLTVSRPSRCHWRGASTPSTPVQTAKATVLRPRRVTLTAGDETAAQPGPRGLEPVAHRASVQRPELRGLPAADRPTRGSTSRTNDPLLARDARASDLTTAGQLHAGVDTQCRPGGSMCPATFHPASDRQRVSQIQCRVALARRSQVAIVFAGDFTSEGSDRSTLNLPATKTP